MPRTRLDLQSSHPVLVIDPSPPADGGAEALLEHAPGITVHSSNRLEDALDECLRLCPMAVLLVVHEGEFAASLGLLSRLKDTPETAAIPVMFMIETDPLRNVRVLEAGACDVVPSRVDAAELRARVMVHARGYDAVIGRNDALAALQRAQKQLRNAMQELQEARAQPDHSAAPSEPNAMRGRLNELLQLGMELNQIQDFHALMERVLTEARLMIGADAGTIFVREGDALRFAFAQNETIARRTESGETPRLSTFRIPISDRSIAGWVAQSGTCLNIANCYQLDGSAPYRFDPSFDQLLGYRSESLLAVPLKTHAGRVLGLIELINARGPSGERRTLFSKADEVLLEHFGGVMATSIERAQLTESIILRMIRMAEIRDPMETGAHVDRVAGYACLLFEEWARRRGLSGADFERQRDRLRIAAKLHDVGKIGVSDSILKKPARLDPGEYEQMKRHAEIGGMLFEDQPTDFDEAARDVALLHHERWDGSGYPGMQDGPIHRGRKGEEIPLFARIVGLADVFDALSSIRSYKEPWPEARVIEVLRAESGKHFDPELVDIFLARFSEVRAIRDFDSGA